MRYLAQDRYFKIPLRQDLHKMPSKLSFTSYNLIQRCTKCSLLKLWHLGHQNVRTICWHSKEPMSFCMGTQLNNTLVTSNCQAYNWWSSITLFLQFKYQFGRENVSLDVGMHCQSQLLTKEADMVGPFPESCPSSIASQRTFSKNLDHSFLLDWYWHSSAKR